MPAQSQSQRAWAFGVKGPAWAKAHHFDNPGKLPKYVNAEAGLSNVPNPGLNLFHKKLALIRGRKRPGTAQQPGLLPDLPK